MVNKADDNPKILFTPYSLVPGCLPYYTAALPTHFVVLAVPYSTTMNIVGSGNPYTKFFTQYAKQPRLLVIYDAIDDIPAEDTMTIATRKAISAQLPEIEKQFLGVFSWLVQPNQYQIKKLRAIFDQFHYSSKHEPLPEPGKETQFEKQVVVLK